MQVSPYIVNLSKYSYWSIKQNLPNKQWSTNDLNLQTYLNNNNKEGTKSIFKRKGSQINDCSQYLVDTFDFHAFHYLL